MNKLTTARIEKAFTQTQRSRSFAYSFAVAGEVDHSIEIDIMQNDEPLTSVSIADNFTIDAIVNTLSEAITEETTRRDAARAAAELERISQPATPAELRYFKSVVGYVEYLMRRHAAIRNEVAGKLAEGKELSVSTLDELTQSTGRYEAAARVWSIAKRDETVKKSLRDISEIVDRETGFFNPNNSSSNAANVINAFSTAAYIEFGQITRGRERY
ncbi:hypothetical protein FDI41_gp71 [Arthrobacter phage Piccoletto]|uniref:Uncharacterized protein n=1 Tax=Arthrobacter phage Piccoletto TaxID=2024282 RepID=A0A222Z865_9CAUD|nr:hypothetical protein FDI41_gp71 [Arthrobacter phage Piccoletto]ASR80701.1 hypothetical protein SEA_PICCOLETTO_71 [Arthrobacter phage Piccoletto]UVK62322.1 hypothetical protein SEA_NATHANVAAG_70 [Arthrobacter phage NathanVaag]